MKKIKDVFHTLFVKKNSHKLVEFMRYFFVSVASLGTDFLLLYLLTAYADFHYLISAAIGYLAGLCVNYLLSVSWVFHKKRLNNKAAEFSVFALIGVIGLGVNEVLMWLFTGVFMLHYMVSRIFSAGIGYTWKYVVRKYLLFR